VNNWRFSVGLEAREYLCNAIEGFFRFLSNFSKGDKMENGSGKDEE
jgi:hypothetical protein